MQNSLAWLLFMVFGMILFVMYVTIRRRWVAPVVAAVIGIAASVVVMTLSGLAQGNTWLHAIFVGLVVGGLFSAGTLVIAFYFQREERRRVIHDNMPPDDGDETG